MQNHVLEGMTEENREGERCTQLVNKIKPCIIEWQKSNWKKVNSLIMFHNDDNNQVYNQCMYYHQAHIQVYTKFQVNWTMENGCLVTRYDSHKHTKSICGKKSVEQRRLMIIISLIRLLNNRNNDKLPYFFPNCLGRNLSSVTQFLVFIKVLKLF